MTTATPNFRKIANSQRAAASQPDPGFWERFVEQSWERAPLCMPGPSHGIASPPELFAALTAVSDAYRAEERVAAAPGERAVRVRFNIDDAAVLTDTGHYLPRTSDGSLAGYVERVAGELGGRRFELVVHDLQAYDFDLWMRMRRFLRGLYARIGVPVEQAEAVVFLRNHEATSFGVHRDDASVFMFGVQGRKRLLAWPPSESFRFCTLDYEQRREDAIVLDVQPGDVAYWPSSFWHVGESVDAWSASISLGVRLRQPPAAEVVQQVVRMLGARGRPGAATYPFDPRRPQEVAGALPVPLRAALDELKDACRGDALEDALAESWLKRMSGYGFGRVPPALAARRIGDEEAVRGRPDDPVVWCSRGGRLVCSAFGHAFSVPESAAVLALIGRLNDGDVQEVGELLGECAALGQRRHALRGVLNELVRLRAVTTRGDPSWRTTPSSPCRRTRSGSAR